MGGTCRVWMGEMCNMYKILIGKPKRNRSSGRPSRRWEDTIKINLKEVGCEYIYLIQVAQD